MKKSFAIDFDGTLATYNGWKGALHLGEPHKGAVEFVNKALAQGHEIVLHTCRTTVVTSEGSVDRNNFVSQKTMIAKLQDWLRQAGIAEGVKIWSQAGKPHCDCYMDDKGLSVRPKDNPEVWQELADSLLAE